MFSIQLYVVIISIFKEDNVFSTTANLPYGSPMNTDSDIIRRFSCFFVSVAMLVV